MNDKELQEATFMLQQIFGTLTTFITHSLGVSRKQLSKWHYNQSFVISNELNTKLKQFVKGEM
ncbi:hypothetical protein G9G63_21110 [Paenibacillus sp. EKM202P]|nr:hypothetical protein [Paenibacillus sp. EKM202P]KAF6561250.1 hypothetical protein G9G63_21110 [Paenibacillus sp. EKM202P]KAF6566114.1 hypothetical protein G9G64_20010 [Paenibacillus sp. EKM207P]